VKTTSARLIELGQRFVSTKGVKWKTLWLG
jgi:hypothetical protein